MDYIRLPHSIKRKNDNGKILAEITFPEESPGIYNIDHTYVSEELRCQGEADRLVKMAVDQIRGQGGESAVREERSVRPVLMHRTG